MISRQLLILELLLLWLAAAAPLGIYMLEAKSSSFPLTCTSIPYPFGISGKAMEGFEISCNGTSSPILQLGSNTYKIEDISLLQGYLSISTGAFFQVCDGMDPPRFGSINLEGTPYMISDTKSSGNMLTMVGCNRAVIIQGSRSNMTTGCVTFCNSINTVISGSCFGLGCCQSSISTGLKSFEITLRNIGNLTDIVFNTTRSTPCSQAFFVRQSSFTFSSDKLWGGVYFKQTFQQPYMMVLDWVIGNETCEEARRKKETYACKENSYCYNSTSGVGYRCNCSQGYQGNPYIEDGCKDINECKDPELNPCVGLCINEPGNVSCACPHGQHGDGRKQGSGCSEMEMEIASPPALALGVGLSVLFILIIGSLLFYWVLKKKKLIKMKAKFFQQNGGLFLQQQILSQGSNATVKIFSIEELEKATNNFNESQILGCGGYGTVYKGVLPSQKVVAIKKSKLVDGRQVEQFINEIVILSQINHRNVVRLLGCCLETQVPLLVYEFISNGTLFHHIHGETDGLSMPWEDRLRIAAEAAGALGYLHSATSIPIIHRDVKSTNILLDENYRAKVSDFGASRSVPFDQTHITTLVQGTFGYLDPEYFHTSKLTEKSDVYSFGVVLVELLTREIPVSFARSEDQRNLAIYFTLMFDKQHLLQLIEPQIVEEAGMEQLFMVAQLARRCLNLKGEERPTMKEVAMELEGLSRFHKQQLAHQNPKEMEYLLGEIGPSNGCTGEATQASRQYSLESDMLASMDLPR